MLKMSFYNGTLDRVVASEIIKKTDKPLMYRYGFAYCGVEKRAITKEKALEVIGKEGFLDIDETEIILNAYSGNYMW